MNYCVLGLHPHTQAARIRQTMEFSSSVQPKIDTVDNSDAQLAELRSIVRYLRKGKEIVDLQLELSKQENARLKSQIEHLTHTLDETWTTSSEVRFICRYRCVKLISVSGT
jgi:nucleoprotein TPR